MKKYCTPDLENILSSSENTYDDSEIDSEDLFEND